MKKNSAVDPINTKAKHICVLYDCTSIKPDEWQKKIIDQLPHSNPFLKRKHGSTVSPGTISIHGNEKDQRLVVNMFCSFYPKAPIYPNDNVSKRIKWFVDCLNTLSKIPNLTSLAFPTDIGVYENINLHKEYVFSLKCFRSKYYLNHSQDIQILGYDDSQFVSEKKKYKIDKHINIREKAPQSIDIVATINLSDLFYLSENIDGKASKKLDKNSNRKEKEVEDKDKDKDEEEDDEDESDEDESDEDESDEDELDDDESDENESDENESNENESDENESDESDKDESDESGEEKDEEDSSPKYSKNLKWQSVMKLVEKVDFSWKPIFKKKNIQKELITIDEKLSHELDKYGNKISILPQPPDLIFNAFKLCTFDELKVVILGQDPYHSNVDEAMGLSFSVPEDVKIPPSLVNIFKELSTDIKDFSKPQSGNLTSWAKQGVLLLNASLTVKQKQASSHMDMWKKCTDQLIKYISQEAPYKVVFMLWGGFAKGKGNLIDKKRHLVLECVHPSPLSASRGGWFGCKHFSKANEFLAKHKRRSIRWNL